MMPLQESRASRYPRDRIAKWPKRPRAVPRLLVTLLVLLAGCADRDVAVEYGRQSAGAGKASLNGTAVLASLFRQAGHRVTTVRRVTRRLRQFDVIVWFPDDFHPPSPEQRVALETWLGEGSRTLIYVGRDYDAAPRYWEAIASQVPPETRAEVLTRQAASQAIHDHRRVDAPEYLFARWFYFDRERRPRRLTTLSSHTDWTDGINTNQLDLHLETRLDPPFLRKKESEGSEAHPALSTAGSFDFGGGFRVDLEDGLEFLDSEQAQRQRQPPDAIELLLGDENDALVTRLRDASWGDSQLLVVTNGSFLLNFALINQQHRQLAGRLIEQCGIEQRVAFLETSELDRLLGSQEESERPPTGLEAFTTWPLGFIVMQAMLVGMILCFVLFPIFGTPRQLESPGLSDFGKHVEAYGRLLERTRDKAYAREIVRHHHQTEYKQNTD